MRIGLIGYGIWGKKILKSILKNDISANVYDIRHEYSIEVSESGGLFFEDWELFLEQEVDGYIVASATSSHKEVLLQIQPKAKPIFVEKPLTNSYIDVEILKNKNLVDVYMMHIWKYHPGVRLLTEIAASGKIGKLLGVKSRRTNWTSPRNDTNSLWNLGIHDLSICEIILGLIPKQKQVIVEKHNGVIRGATVLMGREPYYTFEVSNRYPDKNRDIRLFGTKGVAILKDEKVNYISLIIGDDLSDLQNIEEKRIPFDATLPLDLEIKEFISFLNGGLPPMCNIAEGFRLIDHLLEIENLANE